MTTTTSKQPTIALRPATPNDVDALVALSHKTVLEKYPDVIGREAVEGYVASGAVPKYYRERNAHCIVAEMDGAPVGVAATKDNTVDLMMVTLDRHRSGIGALLLHAAEASLFARHKTLSLDCFRDNNQAVQFYKKHGWVIDSHFSDPEHGIAMVRLVKSKP